MAGAKSGEMISDDVLGFRPGQRVNVARNGVNAEYRGRIVKVVVPRHGERFALVIDDNGSHRYADFHEMTLIE